MGAQDSLNCDSEMNMKVLVLFVAAFLVASPCYGAGYQRFPLRMKTDEYGADLGVKYPPEIKCASWRLAVEAHNIFGFETIPEECVEPTSNYIHGDQYQSDSKKANQQVFFYAQTLTPSDKDVFVFSVDGTALSNVPYYEKHGYGVEKFNSTAYDEWVYEGTAPALPETLVNYNKLLSLGFKIIFITGRLTNKRAVTEANLKEAGFHTWEKLILKDPFFLTPNALEYKSAEREKLVKEGYTIVGNVGDQWSDLLGDHRGLRTFKLPNPMYYIE